MTARDLNLSGKERLLLMGLAKGPIYARAIYPWDETPSKDPHDRTMHALVKKGLAAANSTTAAIPKFQITSAGREVSEKMDQEWAARISKAYEDHDNPRHQKFKTQAEINRTITEYITRGNRAEEQRDRAPFESAAYWKHHDIAVKWFTRAEALMPGGSHWPRDNPAWSKVFG